MSADEAARALDVTLATLYTYVSRKNIRAQKQPGSRSSRYLRADIEQLRAGASPEAAHSPPRALAVSSAVTLVTEGGSYYRGQSAIELARHASLEDIARLLWDSDGVDPFGDDIPAPPAQWRALLKATRGYNPQDRLAMLLPALESGNSRAHDLSKVSVQRSGAHILRAAAAIFLDQEELASGPLHRYIASVTGCGPALEEALRHVLVLAADQALEPATFAVRATANTGATPYRCVLAGFAAISGKRLAAVRTASYGRFLNEIEASSDPTEPIRVRFRENEELPGFGPSPFAVPDPRASALHEVLQVKLSGDARFRHFDRAMQLASELSGRGPDFAFLAALITRQIGADPYGNLIRLSRIVGWIAHSLEQQLDQPLLRFALTYTGTLPK
ncbi:MAG TPA: citrate synthase [Burkholderiaceae bacterium]|nr:citrate synthase [Burkholderiaceae bacterium]